MERTTGCVQWKHRPNFSQSGRNWLWKCCLRKLTWLRSSPDFEFSCVDALGHFDTAVEMPCLVGKWENPDVFEKIRAIARLETDKYPSRGRLHPGLWRLGFT
jgi:hypothetical protein